MDLVFNRPLVHHLLLMEVEDSYLDMITMDILGNRVSFGYIEFDLITSLKYRRRAVRKASSCVRLRKLYLSDRTNLIVT